MRLIIHAGFGKTGSTAIQHGLNIYSNELRNEGILKFGKDLTFRGEGFPHWLIESEHARGAVITENVMKEIRNNSFADVAIISAENLSLSKRSSLFTGVDEKINTTVICYMRPQFQWIPSAWKQWYMKKGIGLQEFIEHCMETSTPNFLESLQEWKATLPQAKIMLRPVEPTLFGAGVMTDFFKLTGSNILPKEIRANEGIDYSLIHIMSKNSESLFTSIHDTDLEKWLLHKLPNEYRRVNAPMIDAMTARYIAEFFREENVHILSLFSNINNPEQFLDKYWCPDIRETSYLEMLDDDLTDRAVAILTQIGPAAIDRLFPSLRNPSNNASGQGAASGGGIKS